MEAALLTAADLGEGWTDIGATPFDQRGVEACPPTNVLAADEDQRRRGEAQTYFTRDTSRRAPTFFESISLWESPQVAEDRLRVFATAPATCVGAVQRTRDGGEAKVTFLMRPPPALGDQAFAGVVRFDFADDPDVFIDVIAVRTGDVIVFTNGERYDGDPGASLDPARLVELTGQAFDKVKRNLPLS